MLVTRVRLPACALCPQSHSVCKCMSTARSLLGRDKAEPSNIRGGIRTRNLLLRREAPYPLGHTSSCKLLLRILRPLSSILCQFRALSRLLCKCSETGCPAVCQTTPVGFEPTRGDPIGLAGRRLNHSAKVSSGHRCPRTGQELNRGLGFCGP